MERYRALFVLRNLADDRAVHWMAKCFDDTSALLKHEVAYCLGQTNNLTALPILKTVLQDENQGIFFIFLYLYFFMSGIAMAVYIL